MSSAGGAAFAVVSQVRSAPFVMLPWPSGWSSPDLVVLETPFGPAPTHSRSHEPSVTMKSFPSLQQRPLEPLPAAWLWAKTT